MASPWGSWARAVLPLALAPTVFQVMMSADMIFFRSLMSEADSNHYGLAGTLARGVVMLLGPLAGVMFPKLVRSHREGKANSLLMTTLIGTAVVGGVVYLFFLGVSWWWPHAAQQMAQWTGEGRLASFGQWCLARRHGIDMIVSWLPWFSGGMLFLSCSNVLLSNLLAYGKFRVLVIPFAIVLGYVLCLSTLPADGNHLVRLIFLFNMLLLLVLIGLVWRTGTWRGAPSKTVDPEQAHE